MYSIFIHSFNLSHVYMYMCSLGSTSLTLLRGYFFIIFQSWHNPSHIVKEEETEKKRGMEGRGRGREIEIIINCTMIINSQSLISCGVTLDTQRQRGQDKGRTKRDKADRERTYKINHYTVTVLFGNKRIKMSRQPLSSSFSWGDHWCACVCAYSTYLIKHCRHSSLLSHLRHSYSALLYIHSSDSQQPLAMCNH